MLKTTAVAGSFGLAGSSENEIKEIGQKIHRNMAKVMIGKDETITLSLVALLAEGHILLEDVPGVGKTTLLKALARSLGADFRRIQFTPDVLPSDLTGVSIYDQRSGEFQYHPGPLMSNLVLADEINRASPKTQSALLECMEEKQVSVDGRTMMVPRPFFVMATQNPHEFHGTYPLPESQLDRFLFTLSLGYPTPEEEIAMLERYQQTEPLDNLPVVFPIEELPRLHKQVRHVHVSDSIRQYTVWIIHSLRAHQAVTLGISPRGTLLLVRAAQALAALSGRSYVLPDDVKYLAKPTLRHRLVVTGKATPEMLIQEVLDTTQVPGQ